VSTCGRLSSPELSGRGGVEESWPAQREPVVTVQVGGEGKQGGRGDPVDVHERAELGSVLRIGRKALIVQDETGRTAMVGMPVRVVQPDTSLPQAAWTCRTGATL
jgi:hypothetical protein